jgi:hypothetical protein
MLFDKSDVYEDLNEKHSLLLLEAKEDQLQHKTVGAQMPEIQKEEKMLFLRKMNNLTCATNAENAVLMSAAKRNDEEENLVRHGGKRWEKWGQSGGSTRRYRSLWL